jgi:hypothetical protein
MSSEFRIRGGVIEVEQSCRHSTEIENKIFSDCKRSLGVQHFPPLHRNRLMNQSKHFFQSFGDRNPGEIVWIMDKDQAGG